jgi:nitroreductase
LRCSAQIRYAERVLSGEGAVDLFETIAQRRSVRAFTDEPIGSDLLQQILMAANQAPSAGNLQAYEIVLVTQAPTKEALARAALHQDFLIEAPVVLAFVANPPRSAINYGQRGEHLYCLQDATIACAYAQLAATALGLATVWVGAFYDESIRNILDLPPESQPAALLAVGHQAEHPPPNPRRALADLVRRETYGGPGFEP